MSPEDAEYALLLERTSKLLATDAEVRQFVLAELRNAVVALKQDPYCARCNAMRLVWKADSKITITRAKVGLSQLLVAILGRPSLEQHIASAREHLAQAQQHLEKVEA